MSSSSRVLDSEKKQFKKMIMLDMEGIAGKNFTKKLKKKKTVSRKSMSRTMVTYDSPIITEDNSPIKMSALPHIVETKRQSTDVFPSPSPSFIKKQSSKFKYNSAKMSPLEFRRRNFDIAAVEKNADRDVPLVQKSTNIVVNQTHSPFSRRTLKISKQVKHPLTIEQQT